MIGKILDLMTGRAKIKIVDSRLCRKNHQFEFKPGVAKYEVPGLKKADTDTAILVFGFMHFEAEFKEGLVIIGKNDIDLLDEGDVLTVCWRQE